MKVISKISQDLSVLGVKREIYAVQNDANTREIQISLFENGAEWIPPEGVSVSVSYRKADGSSGRYDKLPTGEDAISIEKNVVSIILAPAALVSAGKVDVSVVFQDENLNQVSSFLFVVNVQPNTTTSEPVENNYYNYSTLEEINNALDSDFAPAIISSASGLIATATDSANRKIAGLNLYGRTTQNGTPTPTTPVELETAGMDGQIDLFIYRKNICVPKSLSGSETQFGINIQYTDPGVVLLNGTSSAVLTQNVNYSENILLPPGKYTISCKLVDGSSSNIVFYVILDNGASGAEREINGTFSVNLSKPTYVLVFFKIESNSTASNAKFNIQIENNSVGTEWEPFEESKSLLLKTPNGLPGFQVYHKDSAYAANYTDANGQKWIADEIDLARVVYINRLLFLIFDGTENWSITSKGYFAIGTLTHAPMADFAYDTHYNEGFHLCSHFRSVGYYASLQDGDMFSYGASLGGTIAFVYSACPDVASWKAYLAAQYAAGTPVTVLARKANPVETPLPASTIQNFKKIKTNKNTTTIFSNEMPNISFKYVADTKSYIDQKLSAISAAILNG